MNNAKITITVPYDQIPNEIESLISRSIMRMHDTIQIFKNENIEDFQKILKNIESARQKLILVDSNLEDAYNVLLGYIQNEIAIKQEKVNQNESKDI